MTLKQLLSRQTQQYFPSNSLQIPIFYVFSMAIEKFKSSANSLSKTIFFYAYFKCSCIGGIAL